MINAAEGAALQDMTIAGDLILAPGVTGSVTLENVTIQGTVRNFGSATGRGPRPAAGRAGGHPAQRRVHPLGDHGGVSDLQQPAIPIYAGVERNRFSQGDFEWDPDHPDRLIYTGDDYRTRFGIDVSAYQNRASTNNTIDWEAAKADGVEFAMVRIGLRGYGSGSIMEDAFYAQNIDGGHGGRALKPASTSSPRPSPWRRPSRRRTLSSSLLEDREIDGPVAYDWEMHDSHLPGLRHHAGDGHRLRRRPSASASRRPATTPWSTPDSTSATSSTIRGPWQPYLSWYPEYKSASSEQLYPTLYYQMDYWQYSSSLHRGRHRRQCGCEPAVHPPLRRRGSTSQNREIRRGICPAGWRFHGSLLCSSPSGPSSAGCSRGFPSAGSGRHRACSGCRGCSSGRLLSPARVHGIVSPPPLGIIRRRWKKPLSHQKWD